VELHETIPVIYLEVDDEIVVRHAEMEVHEKREKTMRKIKKHMNMMMIALIGTRNMSDLKGEGPPGDFFYYYICMPVFIRKVQLLPKA
jgi:hypothetical protein